MRRTLLCSTKKDGDIILFQNYTPTKKGNMDFDMDLSKNSLLISMNNLPFEMDKLCTLLALGHVKNGVVSIGESWLPPNNMISCYFYTSKLYDENNTQIKIDFLASLPSQRIQYQPYIKSKSNCKIIINRNGVFVNGNIAMPNSGTYTSWFTTLQNYKTTDADKLRFIYFPDMNYKEIIICNKVYTAEEASSLTTV